MRIGIGAPASIPEQRKEKTISHVLGDFTAKEKFLIDQVLDEVLSGLTMIQNLGFEKASTHINSFKAVP